MLLVLFDKGNNNFSHGSQGINRKVSFDSLGAAAAFIEMILSKIFSL